MRYFVRDIRFLSLSLGPSSVFFEYDRDRGLGRSGTTILCVIQVREGFLLYRIYLQSVFRDFIFVSISFFEKQIARKL